MADTFSQAERSAIMQKVKSKGNKTTEERLIAIFKVNNIKGWRKNYPVKGKPDFVFPNHKIAVFADGCLWHGHHCRNTVPKQNADYWDNKRKRNMERDIKITQDFEARGWVVLRFWECAIKKSDINLTPLTG